MIRACSTSLAFFSIAILVTGPVHAAEYKGVKIAPESHSDTYERKLYKHWTDDDGDKEDIRQEVLILESLAPVEFKTNASGMKKAIKGLWVGPYGGFVTTNPHHTKLQIDHMVPLKEAHESGAWAWGPRRKEAYANELSNPQHLIAVKGGINGSKGFKDPSEWMPPNRTYWCVYLTDWVEIKRRWGLTMDQAEVDAIKTGFNVCKKYKSGDHLSGKH